MTNYFPVETFIYFPIEYIIKFYEIDEHTPFDKIHAAINDYVLGMDDKDYYLVNDDIKKLVFDEIAQRLTDRLRARGKK